MLTVDRLDRAAVEDLIVELGIDTIAELSRRSGIDRTSLTRILSGSRPAQNSHVVALARGLGVPASSIRTPTAVAS